MNSNHASIEAAQPGNMPLLLISGALAGIGIVCWAIQLAMGPKVLAETIPWGVYIAAFFLLAGAGSGLIMLTAAGDFGIVPGLDTLRRPLLTGAVACYIAAGFMILMDLGKPLRVFNFLVSPSSTSMFVWDFYLLALTVILALVCLLRKPGGKALIALTALAALGIIAIEGWILAVSPNAVWHSAIIPVMFLAEALIVSLALVLAAKTDAPGTLAFIAAALLLLVLIFSLFEAVTASYMGASDKGAGMALLLSGSLAPLYWGQIVVGFGLPLLLLAGAAKNALMVKVAAVLAILGVFFAKLSLLIAGQALPFAAPQVGYMPSLVEIGGLLGGLGLAAFLFVLGKKMNNHLP